MQPFILLLGVPGLELTGPGAESPGLPKLRGYKVRGLGLRV